MDTEALGKQVAELTKQLDEMAKQLALQAERLENLEVIVNETPPTIPAAPKARATKAAAAAAAAAPVPGGEEGAAGGAPGGAAEPKAIPPTAGGYFKEQVALNPDLWTKYLSPEKLGTYMNVAGFGAHPEAAALHDKFSKALMKANSEYPPNREGQRDPETEKKFREKVAFAFFTNVISKEILPGVKAEWDGLRRAAVAASKVGK